MDITGTPAEPKVSFDLDFPTMSSDTKQMISSVINGQEEMNQQVLYLLAVGRFYSRGTNNATAQTNQTSLAMQSILSGQLSQQINNVIGGIMGNSNWNFGANISTGDEGFNNAEYEGSSPMVTSVYTSIIRLTTVTSHVIRSTRRGLALSSRKTLAVCATCSRSAAPRTCRQRRKEKRRNSFFLASSLYY